MSKVDRRKLKSQEAIKTALLALMSKKKFDQITMQDISDKANVGRRTIYLHYLDKFDLLDQIVMEHINELRNICESASGMSFADGSLIWFDYFERNYDFFSTMLRSKEVNSYRTRFLEYVKERLIRCVNVSRGVNEGLNKEVLIHFLGTAIVGLVESWFTEELKEPVDVVAKQLGILLDRNLELDQ
ncbi:TetR/AcrR family transcriptional regulator [Paenibacillus glycanilyticus]|uniref:TetR/AcrR family transcriptional regulator n=1 Tax=Paenibacillus glycanilyticus TaxID=126569 RepID=UPI0020408EBC|nr:TetR/AcrR family transcriptional regulator [Paenibacillus glycanilyticus]MCM3626285.1 TetR/AcrR family transcriptional regulator [Paenibacillus glycanilyticus]